MKKLSLVLALAALAMPVCAQTYPTSTTLPAAIPDGVGACGVGAPLALTVPVVGSNPGVNTIQIDFTMAPAHTWYGDIRLTLTSPAGSSVIVMASSCDGSLDDSSDVGGPYTLLGTAAQSFDAAAVAAAAAIPAGTYAPDNDPSSLLACGADGTWTATFNDVFGADTGSVSAFSITFSVAGGGGAESFVICQAAPGSPLTLVHTGGQAGAIFINPFNLNTPAAVPTGWCFGLDLPWTLFLDEMTNPAWAGLLYGLLNGTGGSFVAIPGVPAGITIQIVGVHFDGITQLPTFASTATSYTVI